MLKLRRSRSAVAIVVALTFLGAGSQIALAGPFPGCAATSLSAQDLSGCDLRGADFTGFRISGKNLSNANLSGVSLRIVKVTAGSVRLSGTNLRNASLTLEWVGGLSFAGADLRGASISLTSGDASGVSFSGADIRYAKLVGPFPRSVFSGVDLSGVDMSGIQSLAPNGVLVTTPPVSGISGTPASLPNGWALTGGMLIGPQTDFAGVSVDGLDLSTADLFGAKSGPSYWVGGVIPGTVSGSPVGLPSGWTLMRGYFVGPGAWLPNAYLQGCDLRSASLKGAILVGADLGGCDLRGADLRSAGLRFSLFGDGKTFTLPDGTAVSMVANLDGAKLAGANLSRALTGVVRGIPDSLPAGWIAHQWPDDARYSSLIGPGANLTDADISGLDLSAVDLSGVSSVNLSGTPRALPLGWTLRGGMLLGPNVDLRASALAALDLNGVDLSGALIDGADLAGAKLAGLIGEPQLRSGPGGRLPVVIRGRPASVPDSWTVLCDDWKKGAKVNYCLVIGSSASLDLPAILDRALAAQAEDKAVESDLWTSAVIQRILNSAKLRDRDLARSNLEKASLENADLSGSDLSSSNMAEVDAGGTAVPVDTGATGASAHSAAATARGAKLFGANLAKVNLKGAKLKYAGLARVSSGGITGQPKTLPSGWKLTVGYLVGPKANLANANLAGASLSSIKLATATLSGVRSGGITSKPSSLPAGWVCSGGFLLGPSANLAGENLSGIDFGVASLAKANLTGANVTGATLAKANLENVISSGLIGTPKSLPKGWKLTGAKLVRTN